MNRDKEIALIERCLKLIEQGPTAMGSEESQMPVNRYLDETRFEAEIKNIFKRFPMIIIHCSEIAEPGQFKTEEYFGMPLLIVRGQDKKARVFLNVCRHRGMRIADEEAGHAKRFVCPYHAWTYGNDGHLIGVPHQGGFPTLDQKNCSLVELPSAEHLGFIWAQIDNTGTAELEINSIPNELKEDFEDLDLSNHQVVYQDRRVWKANWKILAEGGMEAYHFQQAHRNTVGPLFYDNIYLIDGFGDYSRGILPRRSMGKLPEISDRNPKDWNLRKHANILYSIFPGSTLLVQYDHIAWVRMKPVATDETHMILSLLAPQSTIEEKSENYWEANRFFTLKTLEEDFAIGEAIQAGLSTGANSHLRFGLYESALKAFNAKVDSFL